MLGVSLWKWLAKVDEVTLSTKVDEVTHSTKVDEVTHSTKVDEATHSASNASVRVNN